MTTDPHNATLTHREDLTNELAIIRIQPDQGPVPEFEPGQFITIGLLKPPAAAPGPAPTRVRLTRRAYSIASSPAVRGYVELYVVLVEKGQLTPRLWNIPVGGQLWMDNKAKGEFTLKGIPTGKDLIMISTGTGLAPYLSMLRTYRGQGRWQRLVIIHGVRLAEDLGYRAELEQISHEDPSIFYIPTVTREPADSSWQGMRGRVGVVLEDQTYQRLVGSALDPAHCHVFLCGNPDMIQSVQAQLEAKGFTTQTRDQPGQIHFERYW